VKQSRIGSSPLRRCAPKTVPRLQLPPHGGGRAVPHRLGQPGREFEIEIEVSVDVEQARHQPLAAAVDHRAGPGRIEIDALGGDAALMDGQVICLG
jgi:hypothetical protein